MGHVAGQEAQALAGLDGGPDENDAADLLVLQRVDGAGDREVGLAGARRPDAEREIVLVDVPQVAALVCPPRPDKLAARLDLVHPAAVRVGLGVGRVRFLHDGLLQADVHALGIEVLAAGQLEQGPDDVAADLRGAGVTGDAEAVSAAGDVDVQAPFDLLQVLVELAAEIGETTVVGGFQDDVPGYLDCVQSCISALGACVIPWARDYRDRGAEGIPRVTKNATLSRPCNLFDRRG